MTTFAVGTTETPAPHAPDNHRPDPQTAAAISPKIELQEFMAAIFPRANGAAILASVEDGYRARRYDPANPPIGEQLYCGISSVKDEQPRARILSRKTVDLFETHIIVLDDVGTKVDRTAIKLDPSYIMETSPGNFQYGYIMTYPVDPTRAAHLIEGIANAGLTDPGATRADRIVRVPGSVNRKKTLAEPFVAHLVTWRPQLTYTLSEIEVGLGVTSTEPRNPQAGRPPSLGEGESDPVFDWFLNHGHVIGGPNARGWYPIHCPWENEHSGNVDHGTDYMPGKPGVFKCMHSHNGEVLDNTSIRQWIEDQDPSADIGVVSRAKFEALGKTLAFALRDFKGGGFFNLPAPVDKTSLSQAEFLAQAMRSITLDPADLPDFDRTAAGNASRTQATTDPRVHAVMRRIGMEARLNVSTGGIECRFPAIPEYDPLKDNSSAATEALIHACVRCGMKSAHAIRQGLANWAAAHAYSPVAEWILSNPWDGRSRLQEFYDTIIMRHTSDDPWKCVAIKRWLLQTIAAIRNWERGPDAVDVGHVLVLQGHQGIGKSRWTGSLMPAKWVSLGRSLRLDSNERDAVRRVTSTPITELGEIDGSFRKSDVASLKNFLTTPIDIYRPAYAPTEVARPRGTSFVATVNPEGFLVDQTGERRFWPLAVSRCDWRHGIDMQQLWAEVWTLRETGEQYWLTSDEIDLHTKASALHYAESDVRYAVEDLVARRDKYPLEDWILANAKELAQHYGLKSMTVVYTDLYAALDRAGFAKKTRNGKRGVLVPPYWSPIAPGLQRNFQLIKGIQKTEGK